MRPSALSNRLALHPASRACVGIEQVSFPLDHPYVERCWTSVLGPTGVIVLRRAASLFSVSTSPTVDLADLALELGLTGADSRRRVEKTLGRLARLGFVSLVTSSDVDVFVGVPPMRDRDLRRATRSLRAVHEDLVRERRIELGLHAVVGGGER